MREGSERRRNYFIDREFQTRFILKFCGLIAAASALTGVLIYLFNRHTNTVAFENLKVVVKSTSDFILPIMLEILLIVTVVVGVGTIMVTLFASHKISGPLYKMTLELEKMKRKDLTSRVRIRSTDQLQQAAGEVESLRMCLNESISSLKKEWTAIRQALDDAGNEALAKKISVHVSKIEEELTNYKSG